MDPLMDPLIVLKLETSDSLCMCVDPLVSSFCV